MNQLVRKEILGVQVNDINLPEALAVVRDRLNSTEKGYIVTPNPEIVMLAASDSSYRHILNHSFLSLPDGFGITAAGRILGKKFQQRITGVDFSLGLAALCAEGGFNLFLLGGADNIARRAAETLQKEFTNLKIAGAYSPGLLEENEENIEKRLKEQPIDVLLVAFGPPRQEQWMAANLEKLPVKIAIGVGGTLDYLALAKPRAPEWMRRIGLEWLHRLIIDPRRVTRQRQFQFAFEVFKERLFPSK